MVSLTAILLFLRRGLWLPGILLSAGLIVQCAPTGGLAEPATPPLPPTPGTPAIRVALLSPATGELATFGRLLRNGTIMALTEWNGQGGLLNYHFEWAIYDSGCDFETARQAARQAVTDGFQFILGPLCSDAAIAAAVVAESAGVFMAAPTATHPLVTVNRQGETRQTVFRVSYVNSWQGRAAARFVQEDLKVDKAALLADPDDPYSAALTGAFAETFMAQGGEIVYRGSYGPGQADEGDLWQAAAAAGAGVIYLPADPPVVNRVVGQRPALAGAEAPILVGSDRWQGNGLDREAATGSYFTTHFVTGDPRPAGRQWIEAYKTAYAIEPDTLAVLGYDAAQALATGIEQAGVLTPEAVAAALEKSTVSGAAGPFPFDHQHNPAKAVPVVRIEAGQIVYVTSILPDTP